MAKAKKTENNETDQPAAEKKPAAAKKKAAPKAAAEGAAEAKAPKAAAEKKPAAAAKPAAAKPAAKKPAAKPAVAAGGFNFGIDTNLAAQAAAKMLLNRSSTPASNEGSTVKYLKETLNKPAANSPAGNLLGGSNLPGGKNSNLPHLQNQQKGHNQATGHVGPSGVPRRTPG